MMVFDAKMQTHKSINFWDAQGACAPLIHKVRLSMFVTMTGNTDPILRKTISMPASVWQKIENFQFDNRIKRESEAIRRVIELGLEAAEAHGNAKPETT